LLVLLYFAIIALQINKQSKKIMQKITSTNTLIVTNPIMSPLFTAQLITVASYNKLSTQTQADISVVAYSKQAYTNTMLQSYNAQANANVVYNVTPNLSYSVAV
jgi:hypothetical protein|tara:strand:+ start:317 stop:628 length:312 start_codon:yes stop_codon:yes gene_type:complete